MNLEMNFEQTFSLTGHRVLITGATSGLGFAIAKCCLAAGADVIITGRSKKKLNTALDMLPDAKGALLEITDTTSIKDFSAEVEADFGPVSVLVNNAGTTVKKTIREMSVDEFQHVLNVHVTGAFAVTQAFLPQIERNDRGSILFLASMSSFLGIPNVTGYAAAKSAYVGLIRSLATELGPTKTRVNGIAPGWFDTPLFRGATANDPERLAKIMSRIPAMKLGNPENVGWAAVFLASQAAAYTTGHVLTVDGGALHGF